MMPPYLFEEGGSLAVERYELLGLKDALNRPSDYSSACQELAAILRIAYSKLPKNVQSSIFCDVICAFRLLGGFETCSGIAAVYLLVQAAEVALPKQKKTVVTSEFKHAMVAHKRLCKARQYEGHFPGSVHLPHDVLLHIFRFFDMRSLLTASSVCWAWNAAAKDNMLWMTQYSIFFVKLNISSQKNSQFSDFVGEVDDALLKGDENLSTNFDWRGAFKRKFTGSSSWRLRPHRGFCRHCKCIIWLSGLTCNMPHKCCGSIKGRLKIKPMSVHMLVDYLLGEENSGESSRTATDVIIRKR
ncbi:hypothetical protein HPP92_009775 [Vanilla planifolia]|uniref:F-box domain-containing protein n=1 Tax=Vanilla planifolia TaxID=51239 RepID=A0A835V7A9_VANPL|nr:hypothetical protein HPP92_009775 [Vanilla planifolia]